MTNLLQRLELDREYEYRVSHENQEYIAGANNVNSLGNSIFGNVYLDQINAKKRKIWTPQLIHPFRTREEDYECRTNLFYLDNSCSVMLAHRTWFFSPNYALTQFLDHMNQALSRKEIKMKNSDLKHFFERLHRHYMLELEKIMNGGEN